MNNLLKKIRSIFLNTKIGHYIYNQLHNHRLNTAMRGVPQSTNNGFAFHGVQDLLNYEKNLHQFILKLSKNYEVFINIGANHGINIIRFAHYFDKLIAFEALPSNLQLLLKNVYINNLSNKVLVYPFAVGDDNKVTKFFGQSTGGSLLSGWNGQSNSSAYVQMVSASKFLKDDILNKKNLFLIDVEGAELNVVKGLLDIIQNNVHITDFIIEIACKQFMPNEFFNSDFIETFELFFKFQYSSYEIQDCGSIIKLSKDDVHRMDNNRYEGIMVLFTKKSLNDLTVK